MDSEENTKIAAYHTGWTAYNLSWSNSPNLPFRFAVSSFLPKYKNVVDIVELKEKEMVCRATWEHAYPPTKLMFSPSRSTTGPELVATTADCLRLWQVNPMAPGLCGVKERELPEHQEADPTTGLSSQTPKEVLQEIQRASPMSVKTTHQPVVELDSEVKLRKMFDFGKPNDFCSPVTSFDWNVDDPSIVGCCSIDTTVTIWDIDAEKHLRQLIAHDKEVYDLSFARDKNMFASCGLDGSVRLFDLREMEHCTVAYESSPAMPLMRVAWNPQDQMLLSTFGLSSAEIILIDIRYPTNPVGILREGCSKPVNSMNWAPHSPSYLCSAGEDAFAIIWNIGEVPAQPPTRYLSYEAPTRINNICWSAQHHDYIAISTGEQVEVLLI